MTQTLVQRSVETEFGIFDYTPSPLEELAEHLARQWKVNLSDLLPRHDFKDVKASQDGLVKRVTSDDVEIYYSKQGSEVEMRGAVKGLRTAGECWTAMAKALYETNNPGEEYLNLRKGNKNVIITFKQVLKKLNLFMELLKMH